MKKRLCYSNDEQNPMRKPNTGMIDDILNKGIIEDSKTWGVRSSRVKEGRYRCVRSGLGPADGEGAGDRPVPVRLR